MPAYLTSPQPVQVVALYPGDRLALVNNAAVDSNITKTIQFAIGPQPGAAGESLTIVNTTNQQATGQLAANSATASVPEDGDYEPASGMIVGAGQSLTYNVAGGWCRFTFATAPTSGSLVVTA